MTVLVTGGAGYIGSHMVWALLDAGERVVVLDRLTTGFEWAVAPQAKLIVGDVGDPNLVEAVIEQYEIEAVFHFAGSVVVPESVSDPLGYYHNNTSNTRTLIEAAVRQGVRHLIFSSTAAVYGATGSEPVSEDAPLRPETPYGMSKLMSEMMLRDAAAAHGFTYTCLRYFNVSGADPLGRTGQSTQGATHLLKVACEAALGKRASISVFGTDYPTRDGTCIRDFMHVTDLVDAHLLALARLRSGGVSLTVNCGYGRGFSVLELIDSVRRISGMDFKVELCEPRSGDMPSVIADPTRAHEELGWKPVHDNLDKIVADALSWEAALARRDLRETLKRSRERDSIAGRLSAS
ncbi:UDP-glucose 4-epimerase GalE [Aquamicrobium zhengzhouense]|uniref:UDP-glucose 4-epimerase n=1 Tax=Aquamicrobium zhengzhouense TaxID=2781738 RepID=A0ABS0SAD3_9HYPH|nr:UDP-glucose 4-epimerase GalE [Aquamicrobium zhengzhouense]MBI1620191.1 UDP-glucose 4-epimerase GalE [Aquamicrobium zhengzhouense]